MTSSCGASDAQRRHGSHTASGTLPRTGHESRSSCESLYAQSMCFPSTPGAPGLSPKLCRLHQVRMQSWGWASATGTPRGLGPAGRPFQKGPGAGEPAPGLGWCLLADGMLQEIPPVPAQLLRPTTCLLQPGSTGMGPLAVGCPLPTLSPFLCLPTDVPPAGAAHPGRQRSGSGQKALGSAICTARTWAPLAPPHVRRRTRAPACPP